MEINTNVYDILSKKTNNPIQAKKQLDLLIINLDQIVSVTDVDQDRIRIKIQLTQDVKHSTAIWYCDVVWNNYYKAYCLEFDYGHVNAVNASLIAKDLALIAAFVNHLNK